MKRVNGLYDSVGIQVRIILKKQRNVYTETTDARNLKMYCAIFVMNLLLAPDLFYTGQILKGFQELLI